METDGSSYILFPYPMKNDPARTKFSPYCGITGYRLFPRGMIMMADDMGNKDYMAVIVSKDSLNVFDINQQVNAAKTGGFVNNINKALQSYSVGNVQFTADAAGTMHFEVATNSKTAVATIVEIEKQ
jgi:hypothetical protein